MDTIIDVVNLIKRYNGAEKNAVDDISFAVKRGEFFSLLGPNGAGKTTTISILTTTLSKTSGQVKIAGSDLDKNASQVRRKVGIIFQKPSLDQNLTAEENIRLHAVLYGLYPFRPTFGLMPKEYRQKVEELTEILGAKDLIFGPVKTFSGGMKRKMEIIRSLMHDPKVLFLDEPTEGLDPVSRRNLWVYLLKMQKENDTTFFLTTHYLEEAEKADHVCIINDGKIVILGTPSAIKRSIIEEYLLIDAQDKTKLRNELKRLDMDYVEDGVFKVKMKNHNAQAIIQAIKTPLTTLSIHNPSLEDAYLEIIERTHHE